MNKVIIAITVRSFSSRLKKKAFIKIGKKRIIEWCINNCQESLIDNKSIILATTHRKEDQKFKSIAKKNKISFFSGSEKNVINRLLKLTKKKKADYIIRVTGDSPLIDPRLINELINYTDKGYDFVYFKNGPLGIKPELISKKSLIKLSNYNSTKNCEYLSLFYKNNLKKFRVKQKEFYLKKKYNRLRLNIDYTLDLEMHRKILKKLGDKKYNLENVIKISSKYNNIFQHNSSISPIYEKGKLADNLRKLTKLT